MGMNTVLHYDAHCPCTGSSARSRVSTCSRTAPHILLPTTVRVSTCSRTAPQVLLPAAVYLPVRLGLAAEVRGAGGAGLQRQRATGARFHGHRQRRAGDGPAQPRGQGTYARPGVAAVCAAALADVIDLI